MKNDLAKDLDVWESDIKMSSFGLLKISMNNTRVNNTIFGINTITDQKNRLFWSIKLEKKCYLKILGLAGYQSENTS